MIYASIASLLFSYFLSTCERQQLNDLAPIGVGVSALEHSLDRQEMLDRLQFYPVAQILQFLRVVAVLLYICGISRLAWAVNTPFMWAFVGVVYAFVSLPTIALWWFL